MGAKKGVKWDPLILKLADYTLNNEISQDNNGHKKILTIKENGVAAIEKRRSPEEFKAYIHEIFENDPTKMKYQPHFAWYFRSNKKKKSVYFR